MATLLDLRTHENAHLTRTRAEGEALAGTHAGMAHFAGTGPALATCRQCSEWRSEGWTSPNGKSGGALKASCCLKFSRLMRGDGPKVPHDAAACKHFVLNDRPPTIRDARSR